MPDHGIGQMEIIKKKKTLFLERFQPKWCTTGTGSYNLGQAQAIRCS